MRPSTILFARELRLARQPNPLTLYGASLWRDGASYKHGVRLKPDATDVPMFAVQERFRKAVDLPAQRRVGNRQRKQEGPGSRQRRFGVLTGKMRLVHDGICEEGAHAEKR